MAIYTQINSDLLNEAKQTVTLRYVDGESNWRDIDVELPAYVDYTNPYALDLTQFIPNIIKFDLDRFFTLVKELMDSTLTRSGQPLVNFTEEYPPFNMGEFGNEVISYKVVSRRPAATDQNQSIRPQKYRYSYQFKDKNTGNVTNIFTRMMEHDIEITCWALTNKQANKRALWLEELLISQDWVFKSQGADRFYFEKRLADGYETTGQQKLVYRPLRFYLRFNEFLSQASYEIKNIEIDLKITSEN